MQTVRLAAVALSCVVIASAHAAPAPPPPTMDELRALRDAKQDADLVAACQRIVAARDDATYPRHEVRMILADAQLRLKRSAQALDTLKAEAIAAQKANAPDEADEAATLAMLVRAAPSGAYAPTSGTDCKPIDILAADSRATAFGRLFDDRVDACRTLKNASRSATTLAPLAKVAAAFGDVRALQRVNAAATATADALAKELATWSTTLGDQVLDRANEQVTRIARGTAVDGEVIERTNPTELDSNQIGQLKRLASDCQKLPGVVAEQTKSFAATADADAKPSTLETHAKKIAGRVNGLIEANERLQERRNHRGGRW